MLSMFTKNKNNRYVGRLDACINTNICTYPGNLTAPSHRRAGQLHGCCAPSPRCHKGGTIHATSYSSPMSVAAHRRRRTSHRRQTTSSSPSAAPGGDGTPREHLELDIVDSRVSASSCKVVNSRVSSGTIDEQEEAEARREEELHRHRR